MLFPPIRESFNGSARTVAFNPPASKTPLLVCITEPTLIGASQPGEPEGQAGGVPGGPGFAKT